MHTPAERASAAHSSGQMCYKWKDSACCFAHFTGTILRAPGSQIGFHIVLCVISSLHTFCFFGFFLHKKPLVNKAHGVLRVCFCRIFLAIISSLNCSLRVKKPEILFGQSLNFRLMNHLLPDSKRSIISYYDTQLLNSSSC